MSEYKPKAGDRVKVAFEGEVTHLGGGDGVRVLHSTQSGVMFAWVLPEHLEKLPDPEPKWVDGAVVRLGAGGVPLIHYNGDWRCPNGKLAMFPEEVKRGWNRGTLKILWNGDE